MDFGVGLFLQALVAEYADQPLVQDVIAERLRRPVARDERKGIERDWTRALVDDLVLERKEIVLVDRDGAPELQPLAIVVDERHRPADAKRARAFLLPHRVRVRQLQRRAGRWEPAELGIERMRAARGREQDDRRRTRIHGLAIFDQREVVDAPTLERDRARETRRLDVRARRSRKRSIAAHRLRHGAGLSWRLRRRARCRWGLRRPRLLGNGRRLLRTLLRLLLLDLLLLLHLRQTEIDLPPDQDERGEHDGENCVLLVAHPDTRRSARWKSCVICSNGNDSAARRPIST